MRRLNSALEGPVLVELVVHGDDDGIIAHFFDISLAELIEVSGGKFKPAGKRVAANHRGSQSSSRTCPHRRLLFGLVSWACRTDHSRGGFLRAHSLTVQPASTVTTWPVIGLESRRSRKQAVLATSSAVSRSFRSGCL